jgi:hypothetical protein
MSIVDKILQYVLNNGEMRTAAAQKFQGLGRCEGGNVLEHAEMQGGGHLTLTKSFSHRTWPLDNRALCWVAFCRAAAGAARRQGAAWCWAGRRRGVWAEAWMHEGPGVWSGICSWGKKASDAWMD